MDGVFYECCRGKDENNRQEVLYMFQMRSDLNEMKWITVHAPPDATYNEVKFDGDREGVWQPRPRHLQGRRS